jgi:hypothetical protein
VNGSSASSGVIRVLAVNDSRRREAVNFGAPYRSLKMQF